jgi:tricorn protease
VESGKSHEVSQGIDRISFNVSWSPDSRWVAYRESEETGFGTIFLYDTENGKFTPVTNMFTDDSNPAFDPDGKFLYFTSARSFEPRFGVYTNEPYWTEQDGLYLVTLREDVEYPFPLESDEVEVKEEEEDEEKKDEDSDDADKDDADKDDDEAEEDEGTVIDLDGIGNRIVALDVEAGNYFGLEATSGNLFYMSRPADADNASLKVFSMEDREAKTVLGKADGFDLTADGKSIFYRSNGSFGFVKAAPDQKPSDKPLRVADMKVKTDPRAEWKQMYLDAWRLEGDFFYDPGMHGVDWQAMYERYAELVPYVTDRRDLDYVIAEMISEMGAGHSYVRRSAESPRAPRVRTGLLGCDFVADGDNYRIVNILTERDWNKDQRTPLYGPGIDVNEGDYLLKVDGVELDTDMNPYTLFENKVDQQVVLTLAVEKGGETRDITVKPISFDVNLRYVKWVGDNRRRVEELSDGKIGYIHLPDTAFDGAREFAKGYYAQTRKEALIIDERYNGGGFIPAFMLNIMNQKFLNMWKPRYGQDWRTPGFAFNGPMAMVSNAHAGSGGDALPFYFKQYKMGKMIGMRTWGGLVGYTTYIPLMDGGNVTFPEFGLFNLDGEWDVENYGVDPDIEVDNMPEDVLAGRDPQLEKAVEVLLQELKDAKDLPTAPKFPRDR